MSSDAPNAPGSRKEVLRREETPTELLSESSSESIPAPPRPLAPGTVLLNRYRIISLLGAGGMGVVYRADDLKLGQPVALKFVTPSYARNPVLASRLLLELRTGRHIAHPNICRLYDVFELDGLPFISMEYVEGETLSSLLSRIGRLPSRKAIEIARDLCAGLAAAHDLGVIHRDLKPQNVMIDSRGKARIMDFGLALPSTAGPRERTGYAGTPAYMSPEQLRGEEATAKSDLFALGLILYETTTGKHPYEGKRSEELRVMGKTASRPSRPSSLSPEVDPDLEHIILQCLESDPNQRPASARQILMALSDGDPLQAVVDAGETPSPEMVAAAGDSGELSFQAAAALLLTIVVAAVAQLTLLENSSRAEVMDQLHPPQVLQFRAHEMLDQLGIRPAEHLNSTWGYTENQPFLSYLESTGETPQKWRKGYDNPATLVEFWVRHGTNLAPWKGRSTSFEDPPHTQPGMVALALDGNGRLQRFRRIPASAGAAEPPAPWPVFFDLAGLDGTKFREVAPTAPPPIGTTRLLAWEGPPDSITGSPLRVMAGELSGKPVFFEVQRSWDLPAGVNPELGAGSEAASLGFGALLVFLAGASFFFARRNIVRRRHDSRAAWRVATYAFVTCALYWVFTSDGSTIVEGLSFAVLISANLWLAYLAVEPYVRKKAPQMLVGWSRFMAGRMRDPHVGRDILIGLAVAASVRALIAAWDVIAEQLEVGGPYPLPSALIPTLPRALGEFFFDQFLAVTLMIAYLFLFLILVSRFKRPWLAIGIITVLLAAIFVPLGAGAAMAGLIAPLIVLGRFGLLAGAFTFYGLFVQNGLQAYDFSRWYASYSLIVAVVLALLSIYAFKISLQRRPLRERLLA